MKRYALFAGDTHYPAGGWNDFRGSFPTSPQRWKTYPDTLTGGT